jgi:hypothetical protein
LLENKDIDKGVSQFFKLFQTLQQKWELFKISILKDVVAMLKDGLFERKRQRGFRNWQTFFAKKIGKIIAKPKTVTSEQTQS